MSLLAETLRPAVRLALGRRLALLATRQRRDAARPAPSEIAAHQLARFNAVWGDAVARHRFYAAWKTRHGLPARAESLAVLRDFPVLRKADIQEHEQEIFAGAAPCTAAVSGGSTGEPSRFPIDHRDVDERYANMYLGRSWWGIRPFDPIIMIWGHAHVLGKGFAGLRGRAIRWVNDALIGTTRLNAYTLDPEWAARFLVRAGRGQIVVSFASSFAKLLDVVEEQKLPVREAGLRHVILTAERVYARDVARIRELLGIEPIIEYGNCEVGVIAYSRGRTEHIEFLWDSLHTYVTQTDEIVLTTLWDRPFPLINYGTADLAEFQDGGREAVPLHCSAILGRADDLLTLRTVDGRAVTCHGTLFIQICKTLTPEVRSYLVVQEGAQITVRLLLRDPTALDACAARFRALLCRQLPAVDASVLRFEPLAQEQRTVAGKHRFIVRRDPAAPDRETSGVM